MLKKVLGGEKGGSLVLWLQALESDRPGLKY